MSQFETACSENSFYTVASETLNPKPCCHRGVATHFPRCKGLQAESSKIAEHYNNLKPYDRNRKDA